MKKRIAVLCLLLVCCIGATSAYAVDTAEQETVIQTTYNNDGSYDEITLILPQPAIAAFSSSSTKTASKKTTHYSSSGTALWYARLTGTFTYNGSSATATDATITRHIYDSSWSKKSKSTGCTGNMAFGTAAFSKGSVTKSVSLSLTCSKNGTIS